MAFTFEVVPGQRRLPMYLLIDISASMKGQPMRELERAVDTLREVLLTIPQATQTVRISVITFAAEASILVPLTEVGEFKLPVLHAGGGTALGAALTFLTRAFGERSAGKYEHHDRSYRPYVFLLTDGHSTDCCEATVRTFRQEWIRKRATVIGLGCGPDVNLTVLHSITDLSLTLADTPQETLIALFKWAAQSVRIASISVNQAV